MIKKLEQYPSAIAGLCLGIASISLFWSSHSHHLQVGGSVLALVLLLPLLSKYIRHPQLFWEDLRHPTLGSTLPTISMSLMILSYNLAYPSWFGIILWLAAVILHFSFFSSFLYHRSRDFNFDHMIPSWFVPPIGIVTACLTVPTHALIPLAKIILVFGLVAYCVLLPIIISRLCLHLPLDNARKPTLAILAAPASLTLTGYLTLSSHPSPILTLILFGIALLMTLSVYVMLIHLLRLPFSPAFSAYTFPLVISATATFKMSLWAEHYSNYLSYAHALRWISLLQACIASLIIIHVLQHYIIHLIKLGDQNFKKKEIYVEP